MTRKLFLFLSSLVFTILVFLACKKDPACENCDVNNKLPTAIAGNDITILLPQDSLVLDGSNSFDPDGTITSFQWKKISGPNSFSINNAASSIPKVKGLVVGVYIIELKVTDNGGLSSKDTLAITVKDRPTINRPPIANAGTDQTITFPANTVNVDGSSSSDPDNNISSYQWTKISGPLSYVINNPNAVLTPITNLEQGIYEFELKVADAPGLISRDTIRISVLPGGNTEITFTNQVLTNLCYQPDIPGACWINGDSPSYGINISDTANVLPNSSAGILGVWVKMDTSSIWEQVPANCWQYPDPYPQTNFTYCLSPNALSVWSWFFSCVNLAGRKADVKIIF